MDKSWFLETDVNWKHGNFFTPKSNHVTESFRVQFRNNFVPKSCARPAKNAGIIFSYMSY